MFWNWFGRRFKKRDFVFRESLSDYNIVKLNEFIRMEVEIFYFVFEKFVFFFLMNIVIIFNFGLI